MSKIYYIGLDVHMSHTNICVLDANGKLLRQERHRGHWRELPPRLAGLSGKLHICFEASCGYGALYDVLTPVAERVRVAHPGHLRLIFQSKKKHDRIDAKRLAHLLFLDALPAVHVPHRHMRHWRELIRQRERTVAKRTATKNGLRALLRGQGIPAPKSLWSRRGLTWLKELELELSCRVRRDALLEELHCLSRQIADLEQLLDQFAAGHPGVEMLQTIPGVGPRTAEAIVAYLDDPRRFKSSKQVGSYLGLVPRQDQSGKKNRLGHITGDGPSAPRRLLTEAVWRGIKHSPTIKAYYERIHQGNKERRKIAVVATAHYLARVSFAILRHGEVWCEQVAA